MKARILMVIVLVLLLAAPAVAAAEGGQDCLWGNPGYNPMTHRDVSACSSGWSAATGVAVKPTGLARSVSVPSEAPTLTLLASGLEGSLGSGSAIGPDGGLYVTEGAAGRIMRIDPETGESTTFASGLPPGNPAVGIGGPMDVAFIGDTAYALVTLVGSDVGGSDIVGIYRVDGPGSFTPIADIGTWSVENPPPPTTLYDVPTGVQYAMEPYRGGFLVTDGHHNRVLRVISSGKIIEVIRFDNIVPTGLATKVNDIYMAQAGPVPHVPADGKVVVFRLKSSTATEVASGEPLLVDVEFDSDSKLYALSQGDFVADPPGAPALPDTGALVEVKEDGSFTVIVDGLDRPTSLEFIGNTAYVITLGGEVWKIDGGSDLSFGESKAAPAVVTTNLNGVAAVRALDPSRESKAGPDGDDVRPPAGLAQPAPMTAEQQSAPCGPELATATVWARLSCR